MFISKLEIRGENRLKKLIILICIAIISPFVFSTTTVNSHFVMGYIDSNTTFSVNMLNEVLPFDLESKEVVMSAATNVKGIRIGTFSILSNTKDFRVFVAHTPLFWDSTSAVNGDTKTETSIDYRMYLILGNEDIFKDSMSYPAPTELTINIQGRTDEENNNDDTYITLSGHDPDVWPNSVSGILSVVRQSIYVRLEVSGDTDGTLTAARIENLKAGNYVSDVYFFLEATQ